MASNVQQMYVKSDNPNMVWNPYSQRWIIKHGMEYQNLVRNGMLASPDVYPPVVAYEGMVLPNASNQSSQARNVLGSNAVYGSMRSMPRYSGASNTYNPSLSSRSRMDYANMQRSQLLGRNSNEGFPQMPNASYRPPVMPSLPRVSSPSSLSSFAQQSNSGIQGPRLSSRMSQVPMNQTSVSNYRAPSPPRPSSPRLASSYRAPSPSRPSSPRVSSSYRAPSLASSVRSRPSSPRGILSGSCGVESGEMGSCGVRGSCGMRSSSPVRTSLPPVSRMSRMTNIPSLSTPRVLESGMSGNVNSVSRMSRVNNVPSLVRPTPSALESQQLMEEEEEAGIPASVADANAFAESGDLMGLISLARSGIFADTTGADMAASNGHIAVLDWLSKTGVLPSVIGADMAVTNGRDDVVAWLIERDIVPTSMQ